MNFDLKANLLHVTPMEILVGAIRECYESHEKSDSGYETAFGNKPVWLLGEKDQNLIKNIIKMGHTSTLEHISFNFRITGISRLNLQELARHRMASLSVKSTRYTLKELKDEDKFIDLDNYQMPYDFVRAAKYINLLGIQQIDTASLLALENLRVMICSGNYTNDQVKYILPECYKLNLYWTINARSLRNFFSLRMPNKAHFEIRYMANVLYEQVPTPYMFLFDDCLPEPERTN